MCVCGFDPGVLQFDPDVLQSSRDSMYHSGMFTSPKICFAEGYFAEWRKIYSRPNKANVSRSEFGNICCSPRLSGGGGLGIIRAGLQ